jgi:hypothetical protein
MESFQIVEMNVSALRSRLEAEQPGTVVRVVRGQKARTAAAFFDEAAAALQLPLSFGESWQAFVDCTRDFAAPHVLVVANAGWLFRDEPDELRAFRDAVAQLGGMLTVVLQESPGGSADLAERLRSG